MRPLPLLFALLHPACAGLRSYVRETDVPLPEAYSCAEARLRDLEYTVVLRDSVGGLLQAHREITGLRETARRGASAATEVITVGIAGGNFTRYDELTFFFYPRQFPAGNTVEATAGMLTLGEGNRERGAPTDAAKEDARAVLAACAGED